MYFLWAERDSNPRTLMRAVLQTASFNHLHIYPIYFNKKTQSVFVRLGLLIIMFFTSLPHKHNASDRWYFIPRLISAYRFYCYCYVSNCFHFYIFLMFVFNVVLYFFYKSMTIFYNHLILFQFFCSPLYS